MADTQEGTPPRRKRRILIGNAEIKKKLKLSPENIEKHPIIEKKLKGFFKLGQDLNEAWDKLEEIDEFYLKPCTSSDRIIKRFTCINSDRLHCKMSYRLEQCEEGGWNLKGMSSEGHSCGHELDSRKFTMEFRLRRGGKGDVINIERHESLLRRMLICRQTNRLGSTRDISKAIIERLTERKLSFGRADEKIAYLVCEKKQRCHCPWTCVIVWNDTERIWMLSSISLEHHRCPHPYSSVIPLVFDKGSKIMFDRILPEHKDYFYCNFVESFYEDYSTYKIECFNNNGILERQNLDQVRRLLERNCLSQFTDYIEQPVVAQPFEKGGYFLRINGIVVGGFLYHLHEDGTLYIAELYINSGFKKRKIGSSFLCHSSDYFNFIGRIPVKNMEILCRYENKGGMALYKKIEREFVSFSEAPTLGKRYDYASELYCGYSTCQETPPPSLPPSIPIISLNYLPPSNPFLEERRDRGDTFDSTDDDCDSIFDSWNEEGFNDLKASLPATPTDFFRFP